MSLNTAANCCVLVICSACLRHSLRRSQGGIAAAIGQPAFEHCSESSTTKTRGRVDWPLAIRLGCDDVPCSVRTEDDAGIRQRGGHPRKALSGPFPRAWHRNKTDVASTAKVEDAQRLPQARRSRQSRALRPYRAPRLAPGTLQASSIRWQDSAASIFPNPNSCENERHVALEATLPAHLDRSSAVRRFGRMNGTPSRAESSKESENSAEYVYPVSVPNRSLASLAFVATSTRRHPCLRLAGNLIGRLTRRKPWMERSIATALRD